MKNWALASLVRPSYLAGIVAFFVTAIVAHGRVTPYNNYVLLAQAFLQGHVWIDWPGPYIDALAFAGKHYIIEAPVPALLLVPFVTIWHTATNQTVLAIVLAAVAVGAGWELCERYGVSRAVTIWLCAFLLAGTDLLWCAMLGDVWFIAHVSAACFTLLALVELAGKRRGWLVGIWSAGAIGSRFSLVLALPVYAYLLVQDREQPLVQEKKQPRRFLVLDKAWLPCILGCAGILAVAAILWVWYNEARWGTWSDIGYTAWYHQDEAGSPTGPPFQLQYLGYQLQSFFAQLPTFMSTYPWIKPEITGVALTWTSPALVLAFLTLLPANWRDEDTAWRQEVVVLWIAVLLTAAPNFLYYVNGFSQFGMRHALDFEPFFFALMALGVRKKMPAWGYILVAYSVVVGMWGCWYWNAFIRTS